VTSGWADDQSTEQLTYEFSRKVGPTLVVLQPASASNAFSTSALPAGDAANNYQVWINVRVTDPLGAFTDVATAVTRTLIHTW